MASGSWTCSVASEQACAAPSTGSCGAQGRKDRRLPVRSTRNEHPAISVAVSDPSAAALARTNFDRRRVDVDRDPHQLRCGLLHASFRPLVANRLKSRLFDVAIAALSASAAAPIMQSMSSARRRPDSLNNRAASAAWSGVKSRCPLPSRPATIRCRSWRPSGSGRDSERLGASAGPVAAGRRRRRGRAVQPRDAAEARAAVGAGLSPVSRAGRGMGPPRPPRRSPGVARIRQSRSAASDLRSR